MDSSEVKRRYESAKKRYFMELRDIQNEYVSSNYKFKTGDIVRINNPFYKQTLIVLDDIYFANEESYKYTPVIKVSGHMVDDEGYDKTYFPNSTQTIGVMAYADDVIEITSISSKGLRRM